MQKSKDLAFAKMQVSILSNEKGAVPDQNWSQLLLSLEYHINAISRGEDYHTDGKLHSAYVQHFSALLTESYVANPQGDDRKHAYLNVPNIGLDIDEVLCDWVSSWIKLYDLQRPNFWSFDRKIMERFEEMKQKGTLDDFYLSLEPKCNPATIPFEPVCYITSRPVSTEVTEKWLHMHGFPSKPVYTVPVGQSKIQVAKDAKVEVFVDDGWHNFKEFNKNGICCYLFDATHNQKYNVGHKRVKSLNELPCLFYK